MSHALARRLHSRAPRGRLGSLADLLIPVIALAAGYAAVTHGPLMVTVVGGAVWLVFALRYPVIGLAMLAGGQFLLRVLLGGAGDLSRASSAGSTFFVGLLLLLPLFLASTRRQPMKRLRDAWRHHRTVFWPLAVLSVAVVASYISNPSYYGGLKLVAYMGLNLPLMFLAMMLITSEAEARTLLVSMVVISLIVLGSSLLGSEAIWSQGALRGAHGATTTLAGENTDVGIWFARRVALGGLAAIAILLMTRQRRPYLYWAAATATFAGAILAASRGPVLGIVVALLVMIAVPGRLVLRRGARMAILLAVCVSAVVALSFLPGQLADRYRTAFDLSTDESLQARLSNWQIAEHLIAGSPVTGIGLGRFPIVVLGLDRVIYPHNLVLELAVELGIPAALLFLVMVLGTARAGARTVRRSSLPWMRALALAALGILAASFVGALLSGDLRTNEHIWFAAGMIMAADIVSRWTLVPPLDERTPDSEELVARR